jgi:hypothetical protein
MRDRSKAPQGAAYSPIGRFAAGCVKAIPIAHDSKVVDSQEYMLDLEDE